MGFLGFGKKSSWFDTKSSPLNIVKQEDGTFFYPVGAGKSFISGSMEDKRRLEMFLTVPELNAILNMRARAAGNMKIIIVDKDTEEEVKVSDPIADRLRNPNYFQSKEEFFGLTSLFRDIFGDEFIYMQQPGRLAPSGIFTLPPQQIHIENEGYEKLNPFFMYRKLPSSIVYSYRNYDGKNYKLDDSKLLHLNDNNVKSNTELSFLKGNSKIDAQQAPLENILAAYEARNVLIVNRGAIGILSNASKDGIGGVAPLDVKEKAKVQQEFSKYGLTKSQWQVIITNLSLNWQQMAIDVDKLRLFEETKEDTLKLCDAYGLPPEMLSVSNGVTFANKREAQVQFYRDTVIPETGARIAGINKKWFADKDYELAATFEHLPIFSEELKDRARSLMLVCNALSRALDGQVITIEEYRKELKKFGIT